ncbi:MAG: VOC family protein [Candidatus Binataceae bacterium]
MKNGQSQQSNIPLRLHHNAYVVRDQRVTRRFYEDLIGLPLTACWTERDEVFGGMRVYCHTFYELADGGALAFFQFESDADYERFGPQFRATPFVHIALKTTAETQAAIAERLTQAGCENFVIEHGYCRSMYVTDPDGLNLEFTVDHPKAETIAAERRGAVDADLERWLRGDHSSNNNWRHAEADK